MDGPSWVGIGVHRSGTTWFTNLLAQHPEVRLTSAPAGGAGGRKELHYFDAALLRGNQSAHFRRYRALFADGGCGGEFTPDYLRCLWVPPLLAKAAPEALLLVVLRDPLDRFESAMQWRVSRYRTQIPDGAVPSTWVALRGADALWGGMYATQLRSWSPHFPRERFLVVQYEDLLAAPQPVMERVWTRLGLAPVQLVDVEKPSSTSTPEAAKDDFRIDSVPGLRETLLALYMPEVDQLVDEWGIESGRWRHFRR